LQKVEGGEETRPGIAGTHPPVLSKIPTAGGIPGAGRAPGLRGGCRARKRHFGNHLGQTEVAEHVRNFSGSEGDRQKRNPKEKQKRKGSTMSFLPYPRKPTVRREKKNLFKGDGTEGTGARRGEQTGLEQKTCQPSS